MDDTNKRRRGLGVVTPNACTECRKKRAKCDGQTPCGRCSTQNHTCIYEIPVRQSKENMRSEIEQLRTKNQHSEKIIAALVSNDTSAVLLEQLRSGVTIEAILERLDLEGPEGKGKGKQLEQSQSASEDLGNVTTFPRAGFDQRIIAAIKPSQSIGSSMMFDETYQRSSRSGIWPVWEHEAGASAQSNDPHPDEYMKWIQEPLLTHGIESPLVGTWHQQSSDHTTPDEITSQMRAEGRSITLGDTFGSELHDYSRTWTEVTADESLVEHLMALYFCWEYPTFASLSKTHFLEDFKQGRPRYCSSLLVNVILAVGCRFSTLAAARTIPDDSTTAGDHFFAEALRLLENEQDRHNLTTIQALGLMSIREASCGRSSKAIFYSGQSIRLAIEMGLHLERETTASDEISIEHDVRSATFWGAFALDQCWSLSIGRLPQFSRDIKLIHTPTIVEEIEASPWIPYTDDGAPLERNCTQPSNVRSVYKTFCELSEIVHNALYEFYTPGNYITNKSLLNIYTKYLRWYDSIPPALRLGHNFTPAVLFAHMYYHYTILLLFRPFIKLDIIGSGVSPRDVCSQASDAIQTLVHAYSQLYTLRRTPSFSPYFVLTSTIGHLVTHGSKRSDAERIHQGISDLTEMTSSHLFAIRARDILYFLAAHWEIDIDWKEAPGPDYRKQCRPRSTSLNMYCPNIESADINNSFRIGTTSIEDLGEEENPLFLPFPLQGRPLLGGGKAMLEQAGFKIMTDVFREGHRVWNESRN